MLPLEKVRWQLGSIWFGGAGTLFLLLMVQSMAGVYGDQTQAVWGWLLPNILPTLSLMMGVFAATALKETAETDAMRVRRPFARLASALSAFHLLAVASVFIAQVYLGTTRGEGTRPLALFEMANLWLGPLQGLVAAVLAALFFSREDKAKADAAAISSGSPAAQDA